MSTTAGTAYSEVTILERAKDGSERRRVIQGKAGKMVAFLVAMEQKVNDMDRCKVVFDCTEGEIIPNVAESFRRLRVK